MERRAKRGAWLPQGVQGMRVEHNDFTSFFDSDRKRPLMVYGILEPGMCAQLIYRNGQPRGLLNFSSNPKAPGSPPGSAYNGLHGFDAGHCWPARHGFYDPSGKALLETNYTDNVMPEASELNRGEGQELEAKLVKRAALQGPLVIYKGSGPDSAGTTESGIDIPKNIWKVAFDIEKGTYGSWIFPNAAHPAPLAENRIDLGTIEHLTGLHFPFAGVQDRSFVDPFQARELAPPSYIAQCKAAGLKAPLAFWQLTEAEIAQIFNGAGPDHFPVAFNLFLRFVCFTDQAGADADGRAFLTWLLRYFKLAFVVHDFRFDRSDRTEAGFHIANQEMLDNMKILLNAGYPIWNPFNWPTRSWLWTKMKLTYEACESDSGLAAWKD